MSGQLAASIRAKYPGAYDDLDDAALEQQVLAKYPQYADLAQPEAPEAKSIGGFVGNVAESGGRLLSGMAQPFLHPVETAKGLKTAITHPGETLSAIGHAAKDRYGSLDAIGNTLYEDPVGVLADASTLLGGAGALAKGAGAVGKVSALSKGGRLMVRASDMTNPVRAITAPAAAAAREAGIGTVLATNRPSKALRQDFGGGRQIAQTILDENLVREKGAQRALSASTKAADDLLADRQAAGVPGVPKRDVARSLREPRDSAQLRVRLGEPDETPALASTARGINRNNPSEIPLTDAQVMKREAQDLAYEAGKQGLSIKKQGAESRARALRTGIETRVPDVAPINKRTQRLLGATRTITETGDRSRGLVNLLTMLGAGGVGFGAGGPMGAIVTGGMVRAADSPLLGRTAGVGINRVGRGVNSNAAVRAALLARLAEDVPSDR